MAKHKVKRYATEGYVTSDDSNAGMKEAYDEGELERANVSEKSQEIMNEAKGDTILKAMRDEAAKPKVKAAPKAAAPKATSSMQYGAKTPTIGASGSYGKGLGRRSHPEYPEDASKAMADIKQAKQAPAPSKQTTTFNADYKSNPPSAFSRMLSNFSKSREERLKKDKEQYGFAKGGKVSSASARADGIAQRGKTKGTMIMCGGGYAKGKK